MKLTTMIWLVLLLGVTLYGQPTVDSGSTGADGDFIPPGQVPAGTQVVGNCTAAPGCTVTVPLREPPDHIFNFMTVTIGPFVTVKFTRNAANTPVFILAQGDVQINGTIDVSGQNGVRSFTAAPGGPGGSSGGLGGIPGTLTGRGGPGSGPGGGVGGGDPVPGWGVGHGEGAAFGENGFITRMYGIPELLPLIGGSGGGAANSAAGIPGGNGGGGGGAVLIASSTVIHVGSGSGNAIVANGGAGENIPSAIGGGGSGGAIRLVATVLQGSRSLVAVGGPSAYDPGRAGRIRLDSARPVEYTGRPNPTATFNEPGQPIIVFPATTPTVRIVSVASIPTPAQPTFEAGTPDITLPTNLMNPVSIVIEATNVASGTPARVLSTPQYGGGAREIVGPVALTGPAGQPKRATVNVTLPARGPGMPILGAGILSAVIDSVVPEQP